MKDGKVSMETIKNAIKVLEENRLPKIKKNGKEGYLFQTAEGEIFVEANDS